MALWIHRDFVNIGFDTYDHSFQLVMLQLFTLVATHKTECERQNDNSLAHLLPADIAGSHQRSQ